MFTYALKRHFIRVPGVFFAALCLLSTVSHGQGKGTDPPPPTPSTIQTGTNLPSVEQTLVPEGVFAMQLAEALKLGPIQDEASAEKLLSDLGIEPENGWIADYPVTPAVLGDIEKGISVASDQGKIALTQDQALKLVGKVKAKLGFDVNPDQNAPTRLIKRPGNTTVYSYTNTDGVTHFTDDYDSIPKEYRKNAKKINRLTQHELSSGSDSGTKEVPEPQSMTNPSPEVINNYYYEQGPPVVTYYSPPAPYTYLYSWIPYPFWSTGFYFPGFFVLNNFHRGVFFNRHPYFVTHHAGKGAFSHPKSTGRVDRDRRGHLAPDRMSHSRRFSTPKAQAGSRAIVTLNKNRNRSINGRAFSRMDASRRRFSSARNSGTLGNAPVFPNGRVRMKNDVFRAIPHSDGRILNKPGFNRRSYAPNRPRFYSHPAFDQNRVLRSPRSFSGSVPGRFNRGRTLERFQGDKSFRSHRGSSAGASRGRHR